MSARYLTVEEVAEKLQLQASTIRKWIRQGKLPFYKIGSKVRFRAEEIDLFAQQGWHAVQADVPYFTAWQKRKGILPGGEECPGTSEPGSAQKIGCPGKGSGS